MSVYVPNKVEVMLSIACCCADIWHHATSSLVNCTDLAGGTLFIVIMFVRWPDTNSDWSLILSFRHQCITQICCLIFMSIHVPNKVYCGNATFSLPKPNLVKHFGRK
jgi:hypothetical protein